MSRPNTLVLPPRPRTIAYRLVVLTVLAGLLFVGCGRHAAPAVGNAAENPVKNAADKITLTTIDSHGLSDRGSPGD
jgi:hypothetical protein